MVAAQGVRVTTGMARGSARTTAQTLACHLTDTEMDMTDGMVVGLALRTPQEAILKFTSPNNLTLRWPLLVENMEFVYGDYFGGGSKGLGYGDGAGVGAGDGNGGSRISPNSNLTGHGSGGVSTGDGWGKSDYGTRNGDGWSDTGR